MTIIRIQKNDQIGKSYFLDGKEAKKFWEDFNQKIDTVKVSGILSELFMTVVKSEKDPFKYDPSSIASQNHRRGCALKELIIILGKDEVHFTATYAAFNNLTVINAYGQEDSSGILELFSVFVATRLKHN